MSDLEQISLALIYFRDYSEGGGGNQYGSFDQKSYENVSTLYSGRLIQDQ